MHLHPLKASEHACPGSGLKAVARLMNSFTKMLLASSLCIRKTQLHFSLSFSLNKRCAAVFITLSFYFLASGVTWNGSNALAQKRLGLDLLNTHFIVSLSSGTPAWVGSFLTYTIYHVSRINNFLFHSSELQKK